MNLSIAEHVVPKSKPDHDTCSKEKVLKDDNKDKNGGGDDA
jgi:hypothetical protein